MWNRCVQYRWLAAVLLVAVVGCSKLNEARFFGGGSESAAASKGAKNGKGSVAAKWGAFDLKKLCDKLKGTGEVPKRRIEEYAGLRKMVAGMSPWLAANPQISAHAHREAFRQTNEAVVAVIKNGGKVKESGLVAELIQANIAYDKLEGDERDLDFLLHKVFSLPDEGACSNAYLEQFYNNYIHSLDLFGSVVFGSNNTPAQPDTLKLTATLPAALSSARPVAEVDGGGASALWLTLPQWKSSPAAEEALGALDRSKPGRALVLDLRYAGGDDRALLQRFRAGLAGPWSNLHFVVLVNAATRGMPAVFAYEAASRPHVLVLGEDEETYGYGRALKQQSSVLFEGLTPAVVTLGAELLSATDESGADRNADGYRLRVRNENLLRDAKELTPAAIVKKAESWAAQGPSQGETSPTAPPPGAESQERAPARTEYAAPAPIEPTSPADYVAQPYGADGPRIDNDPSPPSPSEEALRESAALQQRLQAEATAAAAPRSI